MEKSQKNFVNITNSIVNSFNNKMVEISWGGV